MLARRSVAPSGSLGAGMALGGGVALIRRPSAPGGAIDPSDLNLLVITDRRVLVGKSRLGKLVKVLLEVPVAEVTSIEAVKARVAFGKVRLHFRNGEAVELDLKSDRDLDGFVAAASPAFAVTAG